MSTDLKHELALTDGALSAASVSVIADKLEVAFSSGNRSDLANLSEQIDGLYKFMFKKSPEAREVLMSFDRSPLPQRILYSMGQLSFASKFAGQVLHKRESEQFFTLLNTYSKYVDILVEVDCSGVELAGKLRLAPETISRNLKRLRDAGIADYRREGTVLINFLTPAARAVLGCSNMSSRVSSVQKAISSLTSHLNPEMRIQVILGARAMA
ncbi:hypothetical protein KW849_18645 [Pseudomonas sp. PDM26]|uniref:helix-turn-helix domain-containing protein n=1 Tax=Pseudomonas sp. PDM26 TaxID=2854766 RepID=UPI001C4451F5|nr:helix-turn-helix domain-containing protein [Pseudomonas sp. PDM26]MBV7548305.1 hypothetical protein [Pseudomonas sp. PDM26]